jgi:hypothetical protein
VALHRHGVALAVGDVKLPRDGAPSVAALRSLLADWNAGRALYELGDLQALNPRALDPEEVLLSLAGSSAEVGGHARADLEREVERLREALKSAPPAGGMPGGVRPMPR